MADGTQFTCELSRNVSALFAFDARGSHWLWNHRLFGHIHWPLSSRHGQKLGQRRSFFCFLHSSIAVQNNQPDYLRLTEHSCGFMRHSKGAAHEGQPVAICARVLPAHRAWRRGIATACDPPAFTEFTRSSPQVISSHSKLRKFSLKI